MSLDGSSSDAAGGRARRRDRIARSASTRERSADGPRTPARGVDQATGSMRRPQCGQSLRSRLRELVAPVAEAQVLDGPRQLGLRRRERQDLADDLQRLARLAVDIDATGLGLDDDLAIARGCAHAVPLGVKTRREPYQDTRPGRPRRGAGRARGRPAATPRRLAALRRAARIESRAPMGRTPFTTTLLGLAAGGTLALSLGACGTDAVPGDADLIAGKKAFVKNCARLPHPRARGHQGHRRPESR